MLPKKKRINQKSEFTTVLKSGKYFSGKLMSVVVLRREGEVSRLGIIVSNRVSKKAVTRNKIRRLLREVAKERLPETGGLFVILVRQAAANTKGIDVQNEAVGLFENAVKWVENE